MLRSLKSRLTLLAVVTIALAGGSVAFATIPDSSVVIHGCYKTATGDLRVIDTGFTSCKPGESPLSWNQTGPTGPQGPGATTFETTVPLGYEFHTLATTANGLTISGSCTDGVDVELRIEAPSDS